MIKVQDGECNGKAEYISDVYHLFYCKNYKKQLKTSQFRLIAS